MRARHDGYGGLPCTPPEDPELASLYCEQYTAARATRADLVAADAAQAARIAAKLSDSPEEAADLARLLENDHA